MDIVELIDQWSYESRLRDSTEHCKALCEDLERAKRQEMHRLRNRMQDKEYYLQLLRQVDDDDYGSYKATERDARAGQLKDKHEELMRRMKIILTATSTQTRERLYTHEPNKKESKIFRTWREEEAGELENLLASQKISDLDRLDHYYYNWYIQRECDVLIQEVVQEELSQIVSDAVEIRRAILETKELDAKKLCIVNNAFKGGAASEVLVSDFNVDLTRRHLLCLAPYEWVNDEIVNFWMQMLHKRDTELVAAKGHRLPSHFFNSFFYTKLSENEYTYANVRRWTRRVDLFNLDKIFIPINIANTHWCLAVIFMSLKKIQYFDSMNGSGLRCLQTLLRYLQDEKMDKTKEKLDVADWQLITTTPDTPQQNNGCDCGVFTSMFAYFLALNKPLALTQKDIAYYRQWMAYSILKNSLED